MISQKMADTIIQLYKVGQDLIYSLWVYVNLFKFSFQVDSDEDTWWKANVRETKEELAARGLKFMNWYEFVTTGILLCVFAIGRYNQLTFPKIFFNIL